MKLSMDRAGWTRSAANRAGAFMLLGVVNGTLLCASGLQSALPARMEYIAEAWDADRSLPDYGVNGFAQTPDGYLWAATYEGVARFDGVQV